MRRPAPLRPELASVLRFIAPRPSPGVVYPTAWPPIAGVLADLAAPQGRS